MVCHQSRAAATLPVVILSNVLVTPPPSCPEQFSTCLSFSPPDSSFFWWLQQAHKWPIRHSGHSVSWTPLLQWSFPPPSATHPHVCIALNLDLKHFTTWPPLLSSSSHTAIPALRPPSTHISSSGPLAPFIFHVLPLPTLFFIQPPLPGPPLSSLVWVHLLFVCQACPEKLQSWLKPVLCLLCPCTQEVGQTWLKLS